MSNQSMAHQAGEIDELERVYVRQQREWQSAKAERRELESELRQLKEEHLAITRAMGELRRTSADAAAVEDLYHRIREIERSSADCRKLKRMRAEQAANKRRRDGIGRRQEELAGIYRDAHAAWEETGARLATLRARAAMLAG